MIISVCPFCRRGDSLVKDKNYTDRVDTSQFCLGCLQNLENEPHDDLSRIDRGFMDNLPYGFILLDAKDRIIHYIKRESQLTGFNPQDLLGKNFFLDVAPCTSVDQFRDKLDQIRRKGLPAQPNSISPSITCNFLPGSILS